MIDLTERFKKNKEKYIGISRNLARKSYWQLYKIGEKFFMPMYVKDKKEK